MPIIHVVTLTFTPDVDDAVIANLSAALDELAPRSGAIAYRHGPDLGIRDHNADYAITAVFDDEETFTSYMVLPEHQRLIAAHLTPHARSRSGVQFFTSANPLATQSTS